MRGIEVLRDPLINKGTAFTAEERQRVGIEGLIPPHVEAMEEQVARVLASLRATSAPLDKYRYLAALQNENETLFFRTVIDNLAEVLPLVYTPTVGEACLEWSRIYHRPRGLYITPHERGRIRDVLRRWPQEDVRVIVVTDGGRILGLGDLGANGMGIPIGKLALYVACAGVNPAHCLPIMLDVGTANDSVRDDAFYIGLREPRLAGSAYDDLVEELTVAAQEVFPGVLLQFEDFSTANAFRLLARFRDRACTFNDDIQGTGAMGLAGLYAAQHLLGTKLSDQRLLFVGAGSANIGIGSLAVAALKRAGLSDEAARRRCWFVDSQGLVVKSRAHLAEHKRPFAQDHVPIGDLLAAVDAIRPTVLIGASGQGGLFTEPLLAAMARLNDRPVILALSNPTSKAECNAQQAYRATSGRAIVATGSPCPPVTFGGKTLAAGQANNAFIFPGIGLGVLASGATRVTDEMFFAAAQALADQVTAEDFVVGRIFPPSSRLRDVAAAVATAVAEVAYDKGIARQPRPPDIARHVRANMYCANYTERPSCPEAVTERPR